MSRLPAEAVVDLAEIRASDSGRVGPKMARLGQLLADGWRVPDGYAVTASALEAWLPPTARGELARLFTAPVPETAAGQPALDGGYGELTLLAERARALVGSQPLPSWLEDAVADAHARLESRTGRAAGLRVAVRSSAVGEDGHAASFAGQYETYLGVSGVADILLHIRKCWASGFSAHALAYRRRFGGASPVPAGDLAVGVLELVDARSAGVAFTVDPVTGDRGVCVVEGNWGLGESVVSGQVTPDHWTVDRVSGRLLTARVGAKLSWAAFS
ncbi:MAG: PEP/pyruvate-binding domain-containing protein, partial [Trebonia sp.]